MFPPIIFPLSQCSEFLKNASKFERENNGKKFVSLGIILEPYIYTIHNFFKKNYCAVGLYISQTQALHNVAFSQPNGTQRLLHNSPAPRCVLPPHATTNYPRDRSHRTTWERHAGPTFLPPFPWLQLVWDAHPLCHKPSFGRLLKYFRIFRHF